MTANFIPSEIDATEWKNLKPYYDQLLSREFKSVSCIEKFLLDRSELDATADEAGTDLYIAMTCNTEDSAAKLSLIHI